jgi:hypothetical protein
MAGRNCGWLSARAPLRNVTSRREPTRRRGIDFIYEGRELPFRLIPQFYASIKLRTFSGEDLGDARFFDLARVVPFGVGGASRKPKPLWPGLCPEDPFRTAAKCAQDDRLNNLVAEYGIGLTRFTD